MSKPQGDNCFGKISSQSVGCPERWEDTTGKKNAEGIEDSKNIVSGLQFLFYCLECKIKIIEHKDYQIPCIRSDKN